jgi:transcription termination factor Rho
MPLINLVRRALAGKKSIEAMELLLKGLQETTTNIEFLSKLKQNAR